MNNMSNRHRLDLCHPDMLENTYASFPFGKIHSEQLIRVPVFSLSTDGEINALVCIRDDHIWVKTDIRPQEARLLLAGSHRTELIILEPSSFEEAFGFPVSQVRETAPGPGRFREFRCILETVEDGAYHRYLLKNRERAESDEDLRKEHRLTSAFSWCAPETQDRAYVSVSLDRAGTWLAGTGDKSLVLGRGVMAHLHRLAFHGSRLSLWIEADEASAVLQGIFLRFRSRLEEEQSLYRFEPCESKGRITRYEIDLGQVPLKSLCWDPVAYFVMPDTGTDFYSFLSMTYRYRLFVSFLYPGQYRAGDGNLFYAYNTSTGMLAFKYHVPEACDRIGFRLKEAAALIIYTASKKYWKKQHIRLVYEKHCLMAQDNGYYFFRYCMESQNGRAEDSHCFYVIDRSAPDYEKVRQYGKRVIPYMSLRHMIYMQAADLLITTDTRSHLYPTRGRSGIIRRTLRKKPVVFLQHGVTAFKKVDFFYGKGCGGGCNLFVVTSDPEKAIIKKYFGYTEQEIVNSGFARWDVLEDHSAGRREILIMPSWRTWLENATPEAFEQSDYYRNYMELLNSSEFARFLEKYDLHANFYLHSLFRRFLTDFSAGSERIRLISFGEIPANELLMNCCLLVTDYSSVSWDVFYQGKPVVFFQFDRELYLKAHGSYLDMEKDLFGPDAADIQTLLTVLEESAESGFVPAEQYARMQKDYFPVKDDRNCRRIYEAIEKRWPVNNISTMAKEKKNGSDR